MEIKVIEGEFTVCRVDALPLPSTLGDFCFIGKTDEELSLVCETRFVPSHTAAREDGWKALRIQGVLDFSLTGILAPIADMLAENGIGIFSVSTYNTDYILVKQPHLERTVGLLKGAGYSLV